MMSIFFDFIEHCMKIFMDDFSIYGSFLDECLVNLTKVLERYTEANLVLNYEK